MLYFTISFRCLYYCVLLLDHWKGQEIQNCHYLPWEPRWMHLNKSQKEKKQIHLLMQNDGWSQDKITFNGKWIKQRIYSACYFQAWQPQLQFSIVIPTHYPWKLKGIQKHDTWWRRRIKLFPQKSERYLECQQLCRALLCGKLDENSAALDYQSATLGKGCRFWMSLISTEWEINASLKYLSAMRAERQLCYASLKAF